MNVQPRITPRLCSGFFYLSALLFLISSIGTANGSDFYVATDGLDSNPGTIEKPFATLQQAQSALRIRKDHDRPATVHLREGTYYLAETLVFDSRDSGTTAAPITIQAFKDEHPTISGGRLLKLEWKPFRDGIEQAETPESFTTDQLFVNGERLPMARYPNENRKERIFHGYAKDAISPERVKRWLNPSGGFLHAMHVAMWGDFHYIIQGKKPDGSLLLEGGWQNNRRMGMHDDYRFVENVFEELDAEGEWFHDSRSRTLYLKPRQGTNLAEAKVEGVVLKHLVEFRGSVEKPIKSIHFQGIAFRHTARTFMENKEPLLRSDWTTYRGGAILFQGAEDCSITDSLIDQVGGNAVFVDGYNRRIRVAGTHIKEAGANGLALVGRPEAVRSPLFEYAERQNLGEIDRTPGPKTSDYPADCVVDDCLIERSGRIEKQTAAVQIAMAESITIRHCSLYDVPRAGINIGDGCWGGHIIEFCDVFDTVKETGDHGSFNSWGRDRYWGLKDIDLGTVTKGPLKGLPKLDVVKPIVLRNNRWRCDHGWDIDLDDGSSHYELRNNLCLNGGIKLREGFYRVVENNIMVNNSFHPHVWYGNSRDLFRNNMVFTAYQPILMNKPWGDLCDFNLLDEPGKTIPSPATELAEASGYDSHSIIADPLFVDPARGDYRVKAGSPALKLGFKNFPMDRFGVQNPRLKAIARTPELPKPSIKKSTLESDRENQVGEWLSAKAKKVVDDGEISAAGLPSAIGLLLVEVPEASPLAKGGFRKGDVILGINGTKTDDLKTLLMLWQKAKAKGGEAKVEVYRDQRPRILPLATD